MIHLASILQKMDNEIFIASGKEHLEFFRKEMTGVTCIDFPGFSPEYSRFLPQYISLLLRIPLLLFHIFAEHARLKGIIAGNKIDIVISDNRFGLWNKKIKTVYVTHQLLIPFPGKCSHFEWIGAYLHSRIIRKYSFCFIPDLPGELNLTGKLSHGLKLPANAKYIGILSRFSLAGSSRNALGNAPEKFTMILSGPEPQRSILRKKVTGIFESLDLPLTILEGKPGESRVVKTGNLLSYTHLASPAMMDLLRESRLIISRSGYSTIMELISIGKSALLVPTPGQTEQEYLAGYLSEKGWFTSLAQKDLERDFSPEAGIIPGDEIAEESRELLGRALDELLNQ